MRQRGIDFFGTATLCASCSAAYLRNVAVRGRGRRLINWGFVGVVVSAIVYFILVAQIPALAHGPQAIVPALPLLASALVVGAGVLLWLAAMLGRRSTMQFVHLKQ
jgi:hypothetical protein